MEAETLLLKNGKVGNRKLLIVVAFILLSRALDILA